VRFLGFIACSLLMASSSGAEYASTEILVIPWGTGPNQLEALESYTEDVPTDTQGWIKAQFPGMGPHQGFVDASGNVFINSATLSYFKVFRPDGGLMLDLSPSAIGSENQFYHKYVHKFHVDSLDRMYFLGAPDPLDVDRPPYVAVADTDGNLLDRLNPFGAQSGVLITNLYSNSDDVLTIGCLDSGFFTFAGGNFSTVACDYWWRAIDGYYYGAYMEGRETLKVIRGQASVGDSLVSKSYYSIALSESTYTAHLLAVSDALHLFVYLTHPGVPLSSLVEISQQFAIVDQISFPYESEKYHMDLYPYISPDGTVYEFRCLDDGLHVIRWSKE